MHYTVHITVFDAAVTTLEGRAKGESGIVSMMIKAKLKGRPTLSVVFLSHWSRVSSSACGTHILRRNSAAEGCDNWILFAPSLDTHIFIQSAMMKKTNILILLHLCWLLTGWSASEGNISATIR